MKLRKFNEHNHTNAFKKFVLITKSESSDSYVYFIEHPQMPTSEELQKFLVEQGSDYDDEGTYEYVEKCVEIENFKQI